MSEPPLEDLSFDPTTWRKPRAVQPVEGDGGAHDGNATAEALDDPRRSRRPFLLLTGGMIALAAVAGAVVLVTLSRGDRSGTADGPPAALASSTERRALVVADPGGIRGALDSIGVPPGEAAPAATAAVAHMTQGSGDVTVAMTIAPDAGGLRLVALDARHADGSGVIVKLAGGQFVATPTAADLRTVVKVVRGEMDAYSFYSSAVAQHLTDSLISPFAQALAFDFDFQREIHQGDVFEAAFEDRVNSRSESVDVGRLLYVSMQTKDKSRALYWFQPAQGEAGWFDANGRSTVRALMRTPVESARISSTFGMRQHPILGFMKMHKGIDFAAPVGTPIYASGDGLIQHAEFSDERGNNIEIRHSNGWESLYFHLSAYAPGITVGAHVRQGQEIGQVGTTGRSTGPHLHYEVHVDGEAVDPASLKLDSGKALEGPTLAAFIKERDRIDAMRVAQTG